MADAESQAVESLGRDDVGMDEGAEVEDPSVELNGVYEPTVQLDGRRTKKFEPTPDNIDHVCRHVENHDLGFLLMDVFPELPVSLLRTMSTCDVSRLSVVRCLANASIHCDPQILLLFSLIY